MAKLMNLFLKEKINPLIGSAGVSAVPMAARVSQVEGQKADKHNFLLMRRHGNVDHCPSGPEPGLAVLSSVP